MPVSRNVVISREIVFHSRFIDLSISSSLLSFFAFSEISASFGSTSLNASVRTD